MGELKLSTGKTVSIDTSKFTVKEWRAFFRGLNTPEQDDAFIEKATGIPAEEVGEMLRNDWRILIREIIKIGQEPLADPN